MTQIALLQMAPQTRTPQSNLNYIVNQVAHLHDILVVLPEFFLSSYYQYAFTRPKQLRALLKPLLDLCQSNRLAFIGSLPVEVQGNFFNRGLYITKDRIRHKDKAQLFTTEVTKYTRGRRNPLFRYNDLIFTLQVCLDISDPLPSCRAVKRGTRLIINPTSVSVDFLRTIGKARALENQVTTIFCNRCGYEKNGIRYMGKSTVSFADGSDCTLGEDETLKIVSI